MGVLALISDPKLVSKVVSNEESGDIPGLPEIREETFPCWEQLNAKKKSKDTVKPV